MCSKRCTKVGGRGEPGNPQPSTSSDTGDSFPFYFVGTECALKEGGGEGRGREGGGKVCKQTGPQLWDVLLPLPPAEHPGGKLSAKLPRVSTLAPAGVWNLLSLCQLATWRWAGLKECVMSEVVGDRGCIYPEGVCRGHWPKGALEAEKSEGKRKGVPRCPSAVPHPNGPRLLCSFIFFLLQTGFFVPISVPLAPTTSPKPVTHGPLEVPQLVAPEGSARSASSTLDPLRSPRGNVNAETQATC